MTTLRHPVALTVLTGFLGSGKTTLLNRLLRQAAMSRCAVVVNEIGEIGLDHLLIGATRERSVALLENGCLCCGARGELADTVDLLLGQMERGEIPPFERVIVETTGLARPGPVLSELLGDERLASRIALDGVVATADALHMQGQLARHAQAREQLAAADALLITKTDLADGPTLGGLYAALDALNPGAPRIRVEHGEIDAEQLFGWLAPDTLPAWLRSRDVLLAASGETPADGDGLPLQSATRLAAQRNAHPDVETFCLTFDAPLPLAALETALTVLLAYHGEQILRVKGICRVVGEDAPVVVHGVQQLLHEPLRVAAWPDDDRRTRLVFIVHGISPDVVRATFTHFLSGEEAAPTIQRGEPSSNRAGR